MFIFENRDSNQSLNFTKGKTITSLEIHQALQNDQFSWQAEPERNRILNASLLDLEAHISPIGQLSRGKLWSFRGSCFEEVDAG